MCDTALSNFRCILETVGGPAEKERAETLLQEVTVIPDQVSERTR